LTIKIQETYGTYQHMVTSQCKFKDFATIFTIFKDVDHQSNCLIYSLMIVALTDSEVFLDNAHFGSQVCYLALVAPSGKCLRGDGRAYLIGLLAKLKNLALSVPGSPMYPLCQMWLLLLSCVTVCGPCHCCPAWQTAVVCCIPYACKVERFALTTLK